MADITLFRLEGQAPEPSLLGSLISGIKKFFRPTPKIPEPAVPYDVVQVHIPYADIGNSNILNTEVYRNNLNEELSKVANIENADLRNISPESINEAFSANAPRRLKPGESIKVKDGEISYEELAEIKRNVDNVSSNDAFLGKKMPEIFVFQNFSPEITSRLPLLEILNEATGNNLHYYVHYDSVLGGQEFFANRTKDEIKHAFGHEIGHRIANATQGLNIINYNPEKHAAMMGEDFSGVCGNPNHLNNSYDCHQLITKLNGESDKVIGQIREKTNELQREQENLADKYSVLAGYGDGGISLNLHDYFGQADGSHLPGKERLKNIEAIMADPAAAKEKLESELAQLKRPILPVQEAETGHKSPLPPQASLADQVILER